MYSRHKEKTKENVPGPGAYKTIFDCSDQGKGNFMPS